MPYANSVAPDPTAPEGSTLFAIQLSILRNNCTESKNLAKKRWNKVLKILVPLPFLFFTSLCMLIMKYHSENLIYFHNN